MQRNHSNWPHQVVASENLCVSNTCARWKAGIDNSGPGASPRNSGSTHALLGPAQVVERHGTLTKRHWGLNTCAFCALKLPCPTLTPGHVQGKAVTKTYKNYRIAARSEHTLGLSVSTCTFLSRRAWEILLISGCTLWSASRASEASLQPPVLHADRRTRASHFDWDSNVPLPPLSRPSSLLWSATQPTWQGLARNTEIFRIIPSWIPWISGMQPSSAFYLSDFPARQHQKLALLQLLTWPVPPERKLPMPFLPWLS